MRRPAELVQVNDRVYCAAGYAISNVLYVVTGSSVVIIDTTESMAAARASLEEFRKSCSLPIRYIIYTHFHGDHTRGAKAFHAGSTQVIAQRRLPAEQARVLKMLPYRERVTALQFGLRLPVAQRGTTLLNERESGYIPPDILFDEGYRFQEGDLSFELYHTQGETVDHLMVWIPEIRTLFPGDLYYGSFPMLSSPMKPDRPVLAWAESLERMRTLQPHYLVPSHGKPLAGMKKIDVVLSNYIAAIRHVHDETINRVNQGKTLEQARHEVTLPEYLSRLPYLQERYGTVAWSVAGIYRQYTGWYDFNPVNLNPGPRTVLSQALLDASGGTGPLLERAQLALDEDQNQLALELTDVVLTARPQHTSASAIRLKALRRLGATAENNVAKNIYRSAAKAVAMRLSDPSPSIAQKPLRLEYSGAWIRSTETFPDGERRPFSLISTPTVDSYISTERVRRLEARTADSVNSWYNWMMYRPRSLESFAESGFHNYGYWEPGIHSQKDACEKLMEVLLSSIPQKAGNILDVACGMGGTTRYLLKYYAPQSVTGINISAKQLSSCRLRAPGCTFLEMSATDMQFADNSFDNLICVEAAFHFVTRSRFLDEAHRVLRPGGRLILSDILPVASRRTVRPVTPTQRAMSPAEYRDLYLRSGFERVEIIDASERCGAGFFRYCMRRLHDRRWRNEIDEQTFQRYRARLLAKDGVKGYYLLVCAYKTAPENERSTI